MQSLYLQLMSFIIIIIEITILWKLKLELNFIGNYNLMQLHESILVLFKSIR